MCGHRNSIRSGHKVQRQLLFVVWIIAFHCLLTVVARADFRILKRTSSSIELFISGTITEQDAKAIEMLSPELERSFLDVKLDSTGGDVDAAMQIGRLIRKYEGATTIDAGPSSGHDANCYSSCALIFISGVFGSISFAGQLGLHRPYLASAPQSRQTVEKQVPLMLSQLRRYVAEMGITENFYQQMVNTEPSQMVIYGNESTAEDRQLWKALGMRTTPNNNWKRLVPEFDPLFQEVLTSYSARERGVTTSEMRQRAKDAEVCFNSPAALHCIDAIRWGLTERVYLERNKRARAACWRDEDEKLLLTIPKKERKDHPLWIKRETCTRNIMLGGS
jgi:hypothetical protein